LKKHNTVVSIDACCVSHFISRDLSSGRHAIGFTANLPYTTGRLYDSLWLCNSAGIQTECKNQ